MAAIPNHQTVKVRTRSRQGKNYLWNSKAEAWTTIADSIKGNAMMMVFKSLYYNKPQLFNNYFSRLTHSYTTRGNRSLLNLPRVRTEAGRKSFRYQPGLRVFCVTLACVAGGFKGLGVYSEGNYGERNEKDVYIFPACAVLYYIGLSHCACHNFPRHKPPTP